MSNRPTWPYNGEFGQTRRFLANDSINTVNYYRYCPTMTFNFVDQFNNEIYKNKHSTNIGKITLKDFFFKSTFLKGQSNTWLTACIKYGFRFNLDLFQIQYVPPLTFVGILVLRSLKFSNQFNKSHNSKNYSKRKVHLFWSELRLEAEYWLEESWWQWGLNERINLSQLWTSPTFSIN